MVGIYCYVYKLNRKKGKRNNDLGGDGFSLGENSLDQAQLATIF